GKIQEQSRAESVAELGSASAHLIIISFSETRFVCCLRKIRATNTAIRD
ncbi:hypothetical protein TSAR_007260, partial [Trichomalopsis sarcophagae]